MERLKLLILNHKKIIIVIAFIIVSCIIIIFYLFSLDSNDYLNNDLVLDNINDLDDDNQVFIDKNNCNLEEQVEYIHVDIKGQVKKPGVYKYLKSTDSRVNDLIKDAGGLNSKADTSVINLSMKLHDQMVIIIYSKDEVKKYTKTKEIEQEKICICEEPKNDACVREENVNKEVEIIDNDDNKNQDEKIEINEELHDENEDSLLNINNATKEELMTIPGIGESKAVNIIKYRETNPFTKKEDIMNVSGIGESIYNKIKDFITV